MFHNFIPPTGNGKYVRFDLGYSRFKCEDALFRRKEQMKGKVSVNERKKHFLARNPFKENGNEGEVNGLPTFSPGFIQRKEAYGQSERHIFKIRICVAYIDSI
ncbi:hypothetical protein NPIL_169681 [Nephila pilipes]|uniref:Uncharacterized protein n=1 Tax=Nephila pilipes TaxID=299642 RepID=A0A8X6KI77_NEPPI|nr:hypothetical protein NPIL_169681 [Nephila pilipes]